MIDRDGLLAKAFAHMASGAVLAAEEDSEYTREQNARAVGRQLCRDLLPIAEGFIMELRNIEEERDRAEKFSTSYTTRRPA